MDYEPDVRVGVALIAKKVAINKIPPRGRRYVSVQNNKLRIGEI
ncbi:hypothetical protein OSCI_950015 [Kamptonema sp. PCC 6506]|nr:hypothetical protein OSCI_950015 [Kamptonema sp. PCC 6506]